MSSVSVLSSKFYAVHKGSEPVNCPSSSFRSGPNLSQLGSGTSQVYPTNSSSRCSFSEIYPAMLDTAASHIQFPSAAEYSPVVVSPFLNVCSAALSYTEFYARCHETSNLQKLSKLQREATSLADDPRDYS